MLGIAYGGLGLIGLALFCLLNLISLRFRMGQNLLLAVLWSFGVGAGVWTMTIGMAMILFGLIGVL